MLERTGVEAGILYLQIDLPLRQVVYGMLPSYSGP